MKKWQKNSLGISVVILILVCASIVSIHNVMKGFCTNSLIEEIISPDKKYKTIIFLRDCGTTTAVSTQASIIPVSKSLPKGSGNLFILDTDHGKAPASKFGGPIIKAVWENNKTLFIEYHDKARVSKAVNQFNDITITYRIYN